MSREQEKKVLRIAQQQITAAAGRTNLPPKEIAAYVVNGNGVRPDQERTIIEAFGGTNRMKDVREMLFPEIV